MVLVMVALLWLWWYNALAMLPVLLSFILLLVVIMLDLMVVVLMLPCMQLCCYGWCGVCRCHWYGRCRWGLYCCVVVCGVMMDLTVGGAIRVGWMCVLLV